MLVVSSMNSMQSTNHILAVKIIELNSFSHFVCIFRSISKSNIPFLTKLIIFGSVATHNVR